MMRQAVAGAIGGYQRYVSPWKGFHCAHWVLHRGESCSAFGKRVVLEEGVFAFRRAMKTRFLECKAAAIELHDGRTAMSTTSPDGANVGDGADGDGQDGEEKPADRKKKAKRTASSWCDLGSGCDVPGCDLDLPSCDCSW